MNSEAYQSPQSNIEQHWRPTLWLAILLTFFAPLAGMLYVCRIRLGLIYFGIALSLGTAEYWLLITFSIQWLEIFRISYIVTIIACFHVYYLVKIGDYRWERRPLYSRWYGICLILSGLFLCLFVTRSFFYEPFRIPSSAMDPTLPIGSVVIVEKFGYGYYGTYDIILFRTALGREIHRGEIIVFEYPRNKDILFIKRVIGLPGDKITYDDTSLIINGRPVKNTLKIVHGKNAPMNIVHETLDGQTYQIAKQFVCQDCRPVLVPAGHYYVLGDNRGNSNDSRVWGFVPQNNIVGRVKYIIKPVAH